MLTLSKVLSHGNVGVGQIPSYLTSLLKLQKKKDLVTLANNLSPPDSSLKYFLHLPTRLSNNTRRTSSLRFNTIQYNTSNMAAALKSALPSHMKPSKGNGEADFARKHHGKSQSHMVSYSNNSYGNLIFHHSSFSELEK